MNNSKRGIHILAFFLFLFFALLAKLFHLQIVDNEYKTDAKNVAVIQEIVVPSRGLIYDRNDSLIVYNSPVFDVYMIVSEFDRKDSSKLTQFLNISNEFLEERLQEARKYNYHTNKNPFLLLPSLAPEEYSRLQEDFYRYPYLSVKSNTERRYQYQNAAMVLGYMGKIEERDLDNNEDGYYLPTDNIGRTGIEQFYEEELRGQKGLQLLLKDINQVVQGRFKNGEEDIKAIPGDDIKTTLDIELQAYAEKLMNGKVGSIVAIEPSTGEILAMVSTPTYKPDWMIGRNRDVYFPAVRSDSLKPLFNRAVSAEYPPGSTYKPIASLIGLQVGAVSQNFRFPCFGGYRLNRGKPGCHDHKPIRNVEDAIKQSCNSYYAENFRRSLVHPSYENIQEAYDSWRNYTTFFGYTKQYNIGLDNVKPGNFPTAADFDKQYNKDGWQWNPMTVISLSIGQGEMQATTLQMAQSVSVIANRGLSIDPHLVKEVGGKPVEVTQERIPIDAEHFDVVVNGMEHTFIDGTAAASKIPGVSACGKTGTAENFTRINGRRVQLKDHSLFVSFAPKENPQIALAIIVENGGFGSTYAAPIASLVMEKHINDTIAASRIWFEQRMMAANLTGVETDHYLEYIAAQQERKRIRDSISQADE